MALNTLPELFEAHKSMSTKLSSKQGHLNERTM